MDVRPALWDGYAEHVTALAGVGMVTVSNAARTKATLNPRTKDFEFPSKGLALIDTVIAYTTVFSCRKLKTGQENLLTSNYCSTRIYKKARLKKRKIGCN